MTIAHLSEECPACKSHIAKFRDQAGKLHHPDPGSLTICAECQALLVFGDLGVRAVTRTEWDAMQAGEQNYLTARGARVVGR